MSKLITDWLEAKRQLDECKAVEMDLRKQIVFTYFPLANEGVNTLALPEQGMRVVYTCKMNKRIVVDVPTFLKDYPQAHRAFRTKYELDAAGYKTLSPELARRVQDTLETRMASPEIKIVLT